MRPTNNNRISTSDHSSSSSSSNNNTGTRRSWAHPLSKLRRNVSAGAPVTESQQQLVSHKTAHLSGSPLNERIRKSPPSTAQLSVLPEDSPPPIMPSSSPGTPPKKMWERQYRHFLKGRNNQSPPILPNQSQQFQQDLYNQSHVASSSIQSTQSQYEQQQLAVLQNQVQATLHSSSSSTSSSELDTSVRGGKHFANMFRSDTVAKPSLSGSRRYKSRSSEGSSTTKRSLKSNTDELDESLRRGMEKSYSPNSTTLSKRSQQFEMKKSASLPSYEIHHRQIPLSPSRNSDMLSQSHTGPLNLRSVASVGDVHLQPAFLPPPVPTLSENPLSTHPLPSLPSLVLATTVLEKSDTSVSTLSHTLTTPSTVSAKHTESRQSSEQEQDKTQNNFSTTTVTTSHESLMARAPATVATSGMKKIFTEFHNARNSGADAVSSFLGDEPSQTGKATMRAGTSPHYGVHLAPSHSSSLAWTQNHQLAASAIAQNTQACHGSFPHALERPVGGITSSSVDDIPPSLSRHLHHSSIDVTSLTSRIGTGALGVRSAPVGAGSSSLETVHENLVIHKSMRILLSIQGVEHWQQGRRYLIAPAVAAACPVSVLTSLSGPQTWTATQILEKSSSTRPPAMFGTIVLGPCLLCYAGAVRSSSKSNHQYSLATLVLKQNYLLEYPDDANLRGMPRAQANLQYATCATHPDFLDSLELRFFGSPCARADARLLTIRLHNRSERDAWMFCLNRAAQLSISDLYEYDLENPLGTGQYASVYSARRKDGISDVCALKLFDKTQFWKMVIKGRERADTIVREVSVQATLTAKCGHVPSFLRIRGFFETADHVALELERLEGTDLFHYISSKNVSNQGLEEPDAAHILRDVLLSLEAMNRIGLAHRDIKPANILMCKGPCVVKVGDFGMSTFVGVDGQVRGRCGTPGYVAPEIFSAGVYGGYGNKIDIFSAGVTLYVMLCGYEPFYGESDAELIQSNKEAKIDFPTEEWKHISAQAKDLVCKMMQPAPKLRLTAKEALEHPWFKTQLGEITQTLRKSSTCSVDLPVDGACVIS